jgi:hypothetical protein
LLSKIFDGKEIIPLDNKRERLIIQGDMLQGVKRLRMQ